MIRIGTLSAAAILALGLAGSAHAQISPRTQDNVGASAAGSKSGVVGKGDSMETPPATTGTAIAPGARIAPSDRGLPAGDPIPAPRTGAASPAR